MKITTKEQAIHVDKPEGVAVDYYLFDQYEVHINEQQPGTEQVWHHHEIIWETLIIIEGELTAKWHPGNAEKSQIVKAGDLIETERAPHSFFNHTDSVAKFIVLKQLPSNDANPEVFKADKVLD